LESQLHRNVEVYVDNVVIKTKEKENLITDHAETFANLRAYRWKLNPSKCVFGVPSGKLLGFMVSHRGTRLTQSRSMLSTTCGYLPARRK